MSEADKSKSNDDLAGRLDAVVSAYSGMTYKESVDHQVKHWAEGLPTHNPIGDECCPDFSCCQPQMLMDDAARRRFLEAHMAGDYETRSNMLMMSLGGMLADTGVKVHIAGDEPEHIEH